MQQKNNERFLGIDPGSRRIGYGVVEVISGSLRLVASGLLPVTAKNPADALHEIQVGFRTIVREHRPIALGIEKLYFSKNQKTAMRVAEARGALLAAARESGLLVYEFNPNEVKMNIAGHGGADKKAVQKMVRLHLCEPGLRVIDDTSDALALAILVSRGNYAL